MHNAANARGKGYIALLSLAALGVVYGDIGTSPLYALRECFHGPFAVEASRENVLSVLSLIFWALLLIIAIKYLIFILRADNQGEGGILALAAIAMHGTAPKGTPVKIGGTLMLLGIFGAALLYGDGMITPAISVLSAIEGLEVATPTFRPYIIPITIALLIGLFAIQSRGTGKVGKVFGPITLVWFVVIGVLGAMQIVRDSSVLAAINPMYAVDFFAGNGLRAVLVMGAVFLVVTGGEALYADMGHFGARPIRISWFTLVYPALLLNYFGQGALLLHDPHVASNPFYALVPKGILIPMVALAALATVIASQALISGAFSLTMQAVQLGYAPRLKITHTSAHERGQVYVPVVNWVLMIACIGLVLGFGSSSNLAAAYGISVTATMGITSILFTVVMWKVWRWPLWVVVILSILFITVDLLFFGANVTKIAHGGWFPIAMAIAIFTIMTTWKRGREILGERMMEILIPLEELLREDMPQDLPVRVPGIALFMTRDITMAPPAMMRNLRHNKVLHIKNIFLTVETRDVPYIPSKERAEIEDLGRGFWRVSLTYGFMQTPDVPRALKKVKIPDINWEHTTYFVGRETLVATERPGMAIWREKLFAAMSHNTSSAASFFHLPPGHIVELGSRVEL